MIMKGHPEFIPQPQPPPIMPPPRPVLISANAEIVKTNKTVKTIITLFIFAFFPARVSNTVILPAGLRYRLLSETRVAVCLILVPVFVLWQEGAPMTRSP